MTTAHHPKAEHRARARAVAERCGAPYLVRRGPLEPMFGEANAELIYVVSKVRDELRSPTDHVFIHEGMMKLKTSVGPEHPFCRAIAPEGAPKVERVLDANMGLAGDALQLSIVLGVEVEGFEASTVICCLLEEGFARLERTTFRKWRDAFARLSVREGRAIDLLSELPDNSRPVVYFDPMFTTPKESAPGWTVFRRVAEHAPLDVPTLEQAIRVASDRVVVKVAHGERASAEVEPGFNRRVCGIAFDYLIVEKALPHPQWERRRLPYDAY